MIVLGLTGSIGTGKSTIAKFFRDEGIPVFDADEECHKLQAAGSPTTIAIEKRFPGTTTPKGGVDRQKLAEHINSDQDLADLEAILHPKVEEARQQFIVNHAGSKLVVLDIPLLFEKGGWQKVDKIVVASAPPDLQKARALARPGMTEEKLAFILSKQLPDVQKRRKAHFILFTSKPLTTTKHEVQRLIAQLLH
jgi:dephospho-CoA kinase